MIKKILAMSLILLVAASFAEECYFMPRLTSIEKPVKLFKMNCNRMLEATENLDAYERIIGKEGWLIMDGGINQIYSEFFDSYYTNPAGGHSFHMYMYAMMRGGNSSQCIVMTSDGPNCGALEYVSLGMAVRDYYLNR